MKITKEINLNITQPNNFQLIHVMQGTVDSVKVIAHLYDGNKPYQIPDTVNQYQILGILSSGKYLIDDQVTRYDDTSVTFVINQNMMAKAGYVKFSLSLVDSADQSIAETFPAKIMVTAIPGQDYEQTDEIPIITKSLQEVKEGAEIAVNAANRSEAYYNKLISEKGQPNGIATLDENTKVPLDELYEATTSSKGITQLEDSITSTSVITAATPNSVKIVNDALIVEKNRATASENAITSNLNSEISRAKLSEQTITDNLNAEITRATTAENNLDSNKLDKKTIATDSTLGLIKSGTDITVDSFGNVSVNDNSHNHTVSNISDLTATASELNVLDGITATTTELNYTDGVKSNIQTQLNAKAPLASPTLTGIPKAPTASAETNTTQIATTAFVQAVTSNSITTSKTYTDTKISDLINGAPTTLDTLGEIAEAMADNQDVVEALDTAIGTKVDKVDGMGLSTNDYTTVEKTKLGSIATGAEVNQNAFSNIAVNSTIISADEKSDTVTFISGDNVTLTPDANTDKVTISSSHPPITHSTDTTTAVSPNSGGTFTTVDSISRDANGHVTKVNTKTVTLPNTSVAVDDALSATSTNPVQNKVINDVLTTYATKESLDAKRDLAYTKLPDGSDLNDATTPGGYYLHHQNTYINMPSQLINGFMEVMVYSNVVKQVIYRQGTVNTNDWTIVERTGYSEGPWSDWVEIVTEKTGFSYGVKTTLANPSAKTSYYIPFILGSTSGNKNILQNNELRVDSLEGTASALGYDALIVGNNTPKGTEGNKYGQLSLYSESAYVGYIKPASLTGNRAYTLPDKAGTFAMTSDIVSSSATTSAAGLMSAADKTKLNAIGFQVKEGTSVTINASRNCIAMGWVEDTYFCIARITTGNITNIWYNGCSFSLSGNTLTLGSASTSSTHFIATWQE